MEARGPVFRKLEKEKIFRNIVADSSEIGYEVTFSTTKFKYAIITRNITPNKGCKSVQQKAQENNGCRNRE
jgi:hypothetical protein